MANTVPAAFEKFRQKIELSGDHRKTAASRKDALVSLLENDFTVLDAFATGSIPRYTGMKYSADLDIIVVLHYGNHIEGKSPSEVLSSVQKALSGFRTSVRSNGQAVTLYYKTWPNVDIVPVSRVVNSDKSVNYYNVPDAHSETWLKSRPRKHSLKLTAANGACGDAFKRLIKMAKCWNRKHGSYLQSFHIEVMALHIFSTEMEDYSWDVYQFFEKAADLIKSPMWYELGLVDDYLDYESRAEAQKRLETARDKARDAWFLTYGDRSDHEGAIGIWRQIFGEDFPSYG